MKKIYTAFDGDEDIVYFNLLKAWKENDNIDFDFQNPHDLNNARDDSQNESIKNQLKKRFEKSNVFLILIGENTKKLKKFIPWEIETAISKKLPIIVANLNKKRGCDFNLTPQKILDNKHLVIDFVPFELDSIKKALNKI